MSDQQTGIHPYGQVAQVISVLGSTGSIGRSTLSVLALHPSRYRVFALSANTDAETLLQQCVDWRPTYAVLCDPARQHWLQAQINDRQLGTEVLAGEEALEFIASHEQVDTVMAAIVGGAGLGSTLAAARVGKKILLANKEALVMAGSFMTNAVRESGACLLPIDSEHNAIFQCLPPGFSGSGQTLHDAGIKRLLLTGSGGPFLDYPLQELQHVTPEQACAHPNWSMGRKISVDSATMMNKGLELVEACRLFACPAEDIDILIHPQSVIHSMVEYSDGSVLAQMGLPDMRTPIAHALAWPERIKSGVASINWTQLSELTFVEPDYQRFPALSLAQAVARAGDAAAIIMNAANEVAVERFLAGAIGFTRIVAVVEQCLEKIPAEEPDGIEAIKSLDKQVREFAVRLCADYGAAQNG